MQFNAVLFEDHKSSGIENNSKNNGIPWSKVKVLQLQKSYCMQY